MKPSKHFSDMFLLLVRLLFLGGGFATIIGFFGNVYWLFDLFAHFREYYLIVFFFIFLIAFWYRLRFIVWCTLVLFTVNLIPWLSLYIPPKNIKQVTENRVIIYAANVQTKNSQYGLVLKQIQDTNPDVIILSEIDTKWIKGIEELYIKYPYFVVPQLTKKDEIIIMSKYPIENGSILHLGKFGRASLTATVRIEESRITFIATHPLPPINKRLADYRDDQLVEVEKLVTKQKYPTILIGDLNISPFSYPYRRLVNNTGLINCSQGFGLQRTWQYNIFIFPIPLSLDHCLYTKGIRVLESYIAKDIGSDHRPIINIIEIND